MYVLAGSSPSELATNLNKKVEVTGPVQQPNAPPSDDGAAANPKVLRPPIREDRFREGGGRELQVGGQAGGWTRQAAWQ